MAERVFGLFVVPKKNTKSNAWLHFSLLATEDGKVIDNEQDRPVCRVCGKRVLAKSSNTTNLFQHLREHHPLVYAELGPKKQPKREATCSNTTQATLGSVVMKSAMYSPSSPQTKDLNRAVLSQILILLCGGEVRRDAFRILPTLQGNIFVFVALVSLLKECSALQDTLLVVLVVAYFLKMLVNSYF